MTTVVLKSQGYFPKNSRQGSWIKLSIIFAKDGTELLKRFLRNCNPTLTHVNSKSLIITPGYRTVPMGKPFRLSIPNRCHSRKGLRYVISPKYWRM